MMHVFFYFIFLPSHPRLEWAVGEEESSLLLSCAFHFIFDSVFYISNSLVKNNRSTAVCSSFVFLLFHVNPPPDPPFFSSTITYSSSSASSSSSSSSSSSFSPWSTCNTLPPSFISFHFFFRTFIHLCFSLRPHTPFILFLFPPSFRLVPLLLATSLIFSVFFFLFFPLFPFLFPCSNFGSLVSASYSSSFSFLHSLLSFFFFFLNLFSTFVLILFQSLGRLFSVSWPRSSFSKIPSFLPSFFSFFLLNFLPSTVLVFFLLLLLPYYSLYLFLTSHSSFYFPIFTIFFLSPLLYLDILAFTLVFCWLCMILQSLDLNYPDFIILLPFPRPPSLYLPSPIACQRSLCCQ